MESKILTKIGIDPGILVLALFVLVIVLFILVINANMKYNRLKSSYNSFMKGKDGRTLEDSIFERFEELDNLTALTMHRIDDISTVIPIQQSNCKT